MSDKPLKRIVENEVGFFDSYCPDESGGTHCFVKSIYKNPTRRPRAGFVLTMGNHQGVNYGRGVCGDTYITIYDSDGVGDRTQLKMTAHQLEALRNHLNKWHSEHVRHIDRRPSKNV